MSVIDSGYDAAIPRLEEPANLDPRPITVAVNPVALVVTECITVTSAMRKHARWAHSSVSAILGGSSNKTPAVQRRDRTGQGLMSGGEQEEAVPSRWGLRGKKGKSLQDNPLMSAFARLRNDLKGCKGGCCARSLLEAMLILQQTSGSSIPLRCYILFYRLSALHLHLRQSLRSPSSLSPSSYLMVSLVMTPPASQKPCSNSLLPLHIAALKQVTLRLMKSYCSVY